MSNSIRLANDLVASRMELMGKIALDSIDEKKGKQMKTTREELETLQKIFYQPARKSGQTLKKNLIEDALALHTIVEGVRWTVTGIMKTKFNTAKGDTEYWHRKGQEEMLDEINIIINDALGEGKDD